MLSFPYMYRAVDTGLAARSTSGRLTEASQSLGAGWLRILLRGDLPESPASLLSGAFLTLAIVIGEFTIATVPGPAGRLRAVPVAARRQQPYKPAAVSLISFGLTWIAMGMIAFLGRSSRGRIQVAGAR